MHDFEWGNSLFSSVLYIKKLFISPMHLVSCVVEFNSCSVICHLDLSAVQPFNCIGQISFFLFKWLFVLPTLTVTK